jgi:hypothetical protein
MKKLKKFLALALAATMACSFTGLTAFAEDLTQNDANDQNQNDDNTGGTTGSGTDVDPTGLYTDTDQLPVMKILKMSQGSIVPDAKFTFNIEGVEVAKGTEQDGLTVFAGPSLGTGKDSITIEMSQNDEWYVDQVVTGAGETAITGVHHESNFDFSGITWTEAGIYRYTVSEDASNPLDYISTYDDSTFTVDVYVGKNTDAEDEDDPQYVIKFIKAFDSTGNKIPIVFVNQLSTTSIVITKKADDYMNENATFTFWIKIPVGGDVMDLEADTAFNTVYTDQDGETHENYYDIKVGGEGKVQNADGKTYTYLTASKEDVDEAHGWCQFQLKANESLTIQGVTPGMIYFLYEEPVKGFTTYFSNKTNKEEISYDYTSYDELKGNTLSGKKAGDAGQLTTSENNNFDTFYNKRAMASNTGIVINILPYAVAVLIAMVACAALLLSKKRRNAR